MGAFDGINFGAYKTWPKVTSAIDGKTYYEVPGHPGVYFDPLRGRNGTVTRTPEQQIEQKKKADQALNPTPGIGAQLGTALTPIVGTAAGVVAANQIANIGATTAATTGAGTGAAATGTSAGAAQGAGILGTTGTQAAGSQAAAFPVGTAANGGTIMSNGVVVEPTILGNAAGMGALPIAGIAAGTYLGGREALNLIKGKDDKSLQGKAGRVVLGMATGGLSELARPFMLRESTRDIAKKHTKELLNQGKDNSAWQGYVQGMRQQYDSAPTDPSKPFAGKYASWEEYKQAGLEASDLTGVYGNLKTFGPEWASLSQEQRQAVTQGLINAGLYDSKKGEVIITDAEAAKKIKEAILADKKNKANQKNPTTQRTAQQPTTQQPVQQPVQQTQVTQQPAPKPQPTTSLPTNTTPYNMRNYYDPNTGMMVGGTPYSPQDMNQAKQNLMGQQNLGILAVPSLNPQQPMAQPRVGGMQPQQSMVPYGQQVAAPNTGILNMQTAPQPTAVNPQQQMQQFPIIQLPQQQQPQQQQQVQPTVAPKPEPQKKITGKPTIAQNTKPTKEEIIAELNKPGALAGLFNGRRDLPKGII